MRMLTVVLASCLASTAAGVATLYVSAYAIYGGEEVHAEELSGVAGMSFISAMLLCALLYAPVLYLLKRRRKGCEPVILYPLVPALLLNFLPFLILVAVLRAGKLSGWGEAALFLPAFVAAGLVFGLGFVWNCRKASATQSNS